MTSSKDLAKTLTRINDDELMAAFLKEILTHRELKDIELRWQLLQELHQGKTQREIAAQYGISLCKITRGAKLLKKESSATRLLLSDKHKGEQNV